MKSGSFHQRVYDVVRGIPSGKVMGYGHVAIAMGSAGAARQVGWALAALPGDTDVPWQRVIRSNGHIALQGDPARGMLQRALLEREGVAFLGDRVDMRACGWAP